MNGDPHAASGSSTTRWPHAVLLVALGVAIGCSTLELSVRIATHSLFRSESSEPEDCCVVDPTIGRIINTTGSRRHPDRGFTITSGDHGIRLNGGQVPPARPSTLVVGDSFAFGDGVNDADTWPAVLERLSGERVINAGMFGFGLDQAVLRAEQLADVYHPDTIVLGFIPHDVVRCEMSYWSGFSKPYFDLDPGGSLRFHPAEVRPPSLWTRTQRLLRYSRALELFFPTLLNWQGPGALVVHHEGKAVACALMKRLAAFGRDRALRVVVLAHPQQATSPPDERALKDAVLACADAARLETVDLFPVFDVLPDAERARLFDRHFTPEGYHLVAAELARRLGVNSTP